MSQQNWGQPPAGGQQGWGPPGPAPQGPPQGYAPPGYGPGYQPGYGYEFTELENRTIRKAATWSKALGIVNFVEAALALFNLNIVQVGVGLAVGLTFFQGGKAFEAVVDTQGNDIHHMMQALDKISTAFMIRIVLICIALVIALIAVLIILAVGAAALS